MARKKKSSVRKPSRRQYTDEFKEEAVQLLLDALEKILQQVSTSPLSFPKAAEAQFSNRELRNAFFGTRKGRVFRAIFSVDGDCIIVTHLRSPDQKPLSADDLSET